MQASGTQAPRSPRQPASALNPVFDYALPRHLALLNSTRSASGVSAGHGPASAAGCLRRSSNPGGYGQGHTSLDVVQDRTGGSDPHVSVNDADKALRATDTPRRGHVTDTVSTPRSRSAPIKGVPARALGEVAGGGGHPAGATVVAPPYTSTDHGTRSGGSDGVKCLRKDAVAGRVMGSDMMEGGEHSTWRGDGPSATAVVVSAMRRLTERGGGLGVGVVELQVAGDARPGRDGGPHTRRRTGNARGVGVEELAVKRLKRQLDSFGKNDLFLGRFEMLGRKHRRRGGAVLITVSLRTRWFVRVALGTSKSGMDSPSGGRLTLSILPNQLADYRPSPSNHRPPLPPLPRTRTCGICLSCGCRAPPCYGPSGSETNPGASMFPKPSMPGVEACNKPWCAIFFHVSRVA